MNRIQVERVKAGDKVFWTDPDGRLCSRKYTIKSIVVHHQRWDAQVSIEDVSGDYLECYASELSMTQETVYVAYISPEDYERMLTAISRLRETTHQLETPLLNTLKFIADQFNKETKE